MCLDPYQTVKTEEETLTIKYISVPCGKCPECRSKRISAWSFRLMQEEKRAHSAHFITLTYSTKTVPITKNGFMSLVKKDMQLFFKRLRKAHGESSIKYYAVGEYGGKTMRPHYHIILFNANIELIQTAWQQGQVHYGDVTGASIGYTLKYISKPSQIPKHRNDDRLREFSLMSKGLGENYISEKIKKWHKADLTERMYLNIEEGKKISMPRYYKEKIYTESERKKIAAAAEEKLKKEAVKELREKNKIGEKKYIQKKIAAREAAYRKADKSIKKTKI